MEESVSKRMRDQFSELPNSDRFSELPNSLIHHIFSFLPIRDVVSTTVLSKRWNNLWTTVPCLNFCELSEYYSTNSEKIRNFVNRVLIFWRGVGILKFRLDFINDWHGSLVDDIDLWVRFAVENKVEELNINLFCQELDSGHFEKVLYCAPLCLNSCSSIRKLSLVAMGCDLRIPASPSWCQLKCLKIEGCFSESLINSILLGSPELEVFELFLLKSNENLNIRSTSLKMLKIEKFLMYDYNEPSTDKVLRICCPNLEVLAILGVLYSKYLFTDISSVTDVTLGFNGSYNFACGRGNELLEETLEQIFSTFQHVDKVTLSYWCVQVLGVLQKKYLLSSLPNVKFFPNLKMLVIKDQTQYKDEFDTTENLEFEMDVFDARKYLEFETKLSKSFMLQLRTVDITSSFYNTSTFRFIEFLFKDASMLEKLVIRAEYMDSKNWFDVAKLLCTPRSSPTVKVMLKKC